jgi:TonB-linked SusC/RagA family outer membrane protein
MRSSSRHCLLRCANHFVRISTTKCVLLLAFVISFLYGTHASAQGSDRIKVSGFVRDTAKTVLPQVTVQEKGTSNSTMTQADGSFSLTVADEDATLVFTFIGYAATEQRVGDQTVFAIILNRSNTDLGEVVVVGYDTRKKGSITGAISTITAKDIDRVHGGATVSTALAGKIPGVTFRMPDGRPGASANIQIRNMGNVLYVIDGIQQDAGQFNNLAQNDIESISVLKDGAAAIYGVRAANGVVVVTTKKGRANTRNTINVDAYAGVQNWSRFVSVLNDSYDYMYYRADAEMNGQNQSTTITPAELDKYKSGSERGYQSFDWKDFIVQKNAPLTSVNVNVTGGTDKMTYYVSATRLDQNSVLGREFTFGRTNLQSNINATVAKGLRAGVNINGRIETRDNPGVPQQDDYWLARFAILRNTPLERPYANDNPAYLNDIKHNETNWAYLNKTLGGKYKSEWRVLQTNMSIEYDIPGVRGLMIRGMYSYYIADHLLNNHEYTYSAYTYNPADDTYKATGGSTNPWREREQIKQINVTTQAQINYNNSFGKHTIGALLVAERIRNQRLRNWIHAVPSTNVLPLIYFSTADTYDDSDDRQARIGYIGKLTYGFANKYFVDVAARRDASYLFAPENRVGYFPSVSAGWRLTEENFMQRLLGNSSVLTELKLRASYGELGDDGDALGLPAYSYIEGYSYNQGVAIIGGVPVVGSRDRGVPITNISWLTSSIADVGADFTLLNGKISGSADYFYRKRSGLRGRRQDILVPNEIGYTLPDENLNSDAQYGYEGAITYNGQYDKLRFTVSANASYSRSKFLESYNPVFFNSWDQYRNSREDRFTKTNWGYEVIGQFQSQEEINNYPVNIDNQGNRTLLPGDLIYRDINNDGKINGFDERPIGYGVGTQPNINYGLSIGLMYKGFDFHIDFSGASGYTWYQNWETKWAFQNDGNLNTIFTDRWHRENPFDVNSAWIKGKYPPNRFNQGGHRNYNNSNDFFAHNVTYLRARTIELGYNIPTSLLSKVKIQKARFYVNAFNLFSFDNLKQFGVDPEVTDENGLQFPQNKFVNAGVNLSF